MGAAATGKSGQWGVPPTPALFLLPGAAKPGQWCPPTRCQCQYPGGAPRSAPVSPTFDSIELSLSKGRNAKAIYQDLVDSHGFKGRYASVKRFVDRLRGKPGQDGVCGHRHTTRRGSTGRLRHRVRWCEIPTLEVTGALACSCSRWATAAKPFGCLPSGPARAHGPNSMTKLSAASVVSVARLCSITSAKECSSRTSTIRL